jgi:archaellum biogenesis protein FlaJ (TadC family)
MDKNKIKDHLTITGIIAAVVFVGFSYLIGSFNHFSATGSDRGMALIIFSVSAILINGVYYESYTEKKINDKEK